MTVEQAFWLLALLAMAIACLEMVGRVVLLGSAEQEETQARLDAGPGARLAHDPDPRYVAQGAHR